MPFATRRDARAGRGRHRHQPMDCLFGLGETNLGDTHLGDTHLGGANLGDTSLGGTNDLPAPLRISMP